MVAWATQDSTSGIQVYGGYTRFTSPGAVDTNGISRFQYYFSGNPIQINVLIDISNPADKTNMALGTTKGFTVFFAMVPASAFAPGVVPTASQIRALGDANLTMFVDKFSYDTDSTGSWIGSPFATIIPYTALSPGTKYWVLAMPAVFTYADGSGRTTLPTVKVANYKPPTGFTENNLGRVVSFWTNRSPAAPVLTAPSPNSVIPPGSTFTLSFDASDPDETSNMGDPFREDVAGVQVQYAPRATPENPNPTWTDLPFANNAGTALGPGWAIYNSTAPELPSTAGAWNLLRNKTISVKCGSNTLTANQGAIPGGDWQLRLRTFDWGHRTPNDGTLFNFSPWGITSSGRAALKPSLAPAFNTSPWSAPVNISIPGQVPPPVPLSPTSNVALAEGQPITLVYQYRNAAAPPFAQAHRAIQIRKVGDTTWTTLVDEDSSSASLVVVGNVGVPFGTVNYYPDPELLTTGWSHSLGGTIVYAAGAPTGNFGRYTSAAASASPFTMSSPTFTVPAGVVTMYAMVRDSVARSVTPIITDASGSTVVTGTPVAVAADTWTLVSVSGNAPASAKMRLSFPARDLGENFDFAMICAVVGTTGYGFFDGNQPGVSWNGTTNNSASTVVGFPLVATTFYEWRVQVTDTDGKDSNYSQVGRFWVVEAPASGPERPLPSSTIDGATLGCGKHRAVIYRRGGTRRVGELKGITHLDWGRVRDDISTSKIVISDWDIDCGNLLSSLQTWAYEVVIFRNNGFSEDRVWEGPITLLTYERETVTIQAKDVMGYAYRRIIRQPMNDSGSNTNAGSSVVNRAMRVLQNTFAPDDPNVLAYLQVLDRTDDAKQYRSTPAYSRTAFEEVDDMAANAGLDYTAIGRSILLWGTKHRIGTLPEFTDDDLGSPPIVSEYGMSMANVYSVSDGNGIYGLATRGGISEDGGVVSGNDPTYGLVEMLSSSWASDSPDDSGTYTQAGLQTLIESFEGYAERSISDRYGPPVVVRVPDNTSLNPGTLISIQQLVPGVVIPLRSTGTLRHVVASQKLDAVKVVEENGEEQITITMSPFSRDDNDPGDTTE